MKKALAIILLIALIGCSCAVKGKKLRLEEDDGIQGLTGGDVQPDLDALEVRVHTLWTELTTQKLTAYITKDKISGFFRTEKDLTEFIAIYASLFRELKFKREIVRKYKVNSITLEQNGVIALVDVTLKGRIYAIWDGKLHEVQKWVKSEGKWYLLPQAY